MERRGRIRFRENVTVWFDQYDLLYYELIYEMEDDADKTPATVVYQLLDEIDDLRCHSAQHDPVDDPEGCLNTCLR